MTTRPVLDYGSVVLRNISGPTRRGNNRYDADDTDPANSARMSFGKTDKGRTREQDLKLCRYLMANWHTTPFEMIEIWLEMKLPIFVARQFVRHRTCTINEISGRYVQLERHWYIPDIVGGKAPNAKQGQEDNLSRLDQFDFKTDLEADCARGYALYEKHLSRGVAPEHARMFLHLNHYTHWLWKQDLWNIMHFLRLRVDSHAQVEAQVFAQAVDSLIREVLPESMNLFDEYIKN